MFRTFVVSLIRKWDDHNLSAVFMGTGEITSWIGILRAHYKSSGTDKPAVEDVIVATRSLTNAVCSQELR